MIERTLAIIKPDAVKKKVVGKIIERIEDEGFDITGMKMVRPTKEVAKGFYAVHKDKKFYDSLTDFMSSGEIVVMRLEREDAISHWRQVMCVTDQARDDPACLRLLRGKERGAWVGQPGNGGMGDRIFFQEMTRLEKTTIYRACVWMAPIKCMFRFRPAP